jgi:hypothetical protein
MQTLPAGKSELEPRDEARPARRHERALGHEALEDAGVEVLGVIGEPDEAEAFRRRKGMKLGKGVPAVVGVGRMHVNGADRSHPHDVSR